MFCVSPSYLSTQLSNLPLEELGRQSSFFKRTARKLSIHMLLLSFYNSVLFSKMDFSFRHWALELSCLLQSVISKQALHWLSRENQAAFAKLLLAHSLSKQLNKGILSSYSHELFSSFTGVKLQDSTTLALPSCLHQVFQGNRAGGKKTASLRIQCIYELRQERITHLGLSSYHINDQCAHQETIEQLNKGELLIRDLGYFKLSVFSQISDASAFFLSRLTFTVKVFDKDSKQEIDLLKVLKNKSYLDQEVIVGKTEKLPARLVAIKLPEPVAEQRRRKLKQKASHDNRKKYKSDYHQWVGYAIFITNVPKETWNAKQVMQAYAFRWRIESIFKCWKSYCHLNELQVKSKLNQYTATYFICYLLTIINLCWVNLYLHWMEKLFMHTGKYMSCNKFMSTALSLMNKSLDLTELNNDFLLELFGKFTLYETNHNRVNYMQALNENKHINDYISISSLT